LAEAIVRTGLLQPARHSRLKEIRRLITPRCRRKLPGGTPRRARHTETADWSDHAMLPITGVPPTGPAKLTGIRRAGAGQAFSVEETAAGLPAVDSRPADTVAESSTVGLLALQEETGQGDVRDRSARRWALELLAELAALQRELLAGAPVAARFARIVPLTEAVPEASDPRLREIVEAIILRARVEAARHGIA
jgi:hypothetical protein